VSVLIKPHQVVSKAVSEVLDNMIADGSKKLDTVARQQLKGIFSRSEDNE